MELRDFDMLSFDCYGTLIDWETGIAATLTPWARSHGLATDADTLLALYARHEASAEERMPLAPYPKILASSFRALGAELNIEVKSSEANFFASSVPDWPAFPDARDSLIALSSHYKLIILSNVDRGSFAQSNARLGVSFYTVITAEDVGAYKPSSHNFQALLRCVGGSDYSKQKLLHVAQSLFHDHVPAKSVGLNTVWINRRRGRTGWGATPPPPTAVTANWEFPSMSAFAEACTADVEYC